MANFERADYAKVDLSPKNPFGMTFAAPDKNRSLFIEQPESFGAGTTKEAQDLLRTVMLAHLVIRHFPSTIETNFIVQNKIFLDELYKHYGLKKPKIIKGESRVDPMFVGEPESKKEKVTYANAHSGGLDSVYRALKLMDEKQPALIAHLRNLNPKGNSREAAASRLQAGLFRMPYEEIKLRNGTDNTGFDTMRTRDMFLGLVASMVAEPYGAKTVLIEGNMETTPDAHFSDYAPAWEFFNNLVAMVGLSSQIEGVGGYEIETIKEVLDLEGRLGIDVLPLIQNCFTAEYQMDNNRRKWKRETPVIAENSPHHWCGSCPKCRRMTLGRLFYHDPRFEKVPKEEITYFISDTLDWMKKYPRNYNLLTLSFWEHLDKLRDRVK